MIEIIRRIVVGYNGFLALYLIVYASYLIISNIYGSIKMFRYRRMEQLHNVLEHEFYYPISIIVPAYNEGEGAVQTVRNLLKLDYRLYEVVVVDDGSTDNTKQLVIDAFSLTKENGRPIRYAVPCKPIKEVYTGKVEGISVTLISKENGKCKADASNAAINVAQYPYFVCMDADEILQKDALKYASRAILEEDNVIAVGGNLKISNNVKFQDATPVSAKLGKNLLVNMQILEYVRGFQGAKIFQNKLNTNLIVSGGYGVFLKSAVIEVGGYDVTSKGEDMELTLHLHRHFRKKKKKYAMKYVPDSVCWTQGPETMKDLRLQRQRWHCGLIQTLSKYRDMILNPQYGLIGMFMIPYTIIYELLNPIFMILGFLVIGWTIADASLNLPLVVYLYLIYMLFGIVLTMVSFLDKLYTKNDYFSPWDVVKSVFVGIAEALLLKPYLTIVTFVAFFRYKKLVSVWNSPSRIKVEEVEG